MVTVKADVKLNAYSYYSVIIQIVACRLQIQNCKENYRVIGRHSHGDIS